MEYKNFSLSKLFTTSPILCELMKKVEELSKLNQIVAKQLKPPLSHHCRVLGYESGILSLGTHSPIWGHTLRFSESELLSHLRSYPEWAGLKSIRSKVSPGAYYLSDYLKTESRGQINANSGIFESSESNTGLNLNPKEQPDPQFLQTSQVSQPIISHQGASFLRHAALEIKSESLKNALLKLAARAR